MRERWPGLLLVLLVTACTATPGAVEGGPTTATDGHATSATADTVACRWGVGDDVRLPQQLDEDQQLSMSGQPPVPLSVAMDWGTPAHDHANWQFQLHTLRWTYRLVTAAADGDGDARALVDDVYRSWLEDNADPEDAVGDVAWTAHAVAMRTQVVTCAVHLLNLASARQVLATGVDWLRQEDHFDGIWNHGVDQSIALLMAGCALGDEGAVEVAVARLDDHRQQGIDAQGVTNEQATGYQQFVRAQYRRIIDVMDACGLDPEPFRDARTSMLPMLVHATRPAGDLAPIGDTLPAVSGVPPEHPDDDPPVATYARGWAFARDGWDQDATWFALRFGEGRIIHGHRDHTSLLYDVLGTTVLTEAGHSGYQPGPWRDWERGHAGHNVVTVNDGGRFLWDHATPLVHEEVTGTHTSLTVTSRPYATIAEHRRAVLVSFEPHAVIVWDTVTAPAPVKTEQLWHLPPGWDVAGTAPAETVTVGPDGLGLRVLQFADASAVAVVEGQTQPIIQGFVATGPDERTPAPVLAYSGEDATVEYLTVLVPTGDRLPAMEVRRDGDGIHLRTAQAQLTVRSVGGNLVASR